MASSTMTGTPATSVTSRDEVRTGPRVVIVGGVAGGMSCATRLRRLDETARITVFEKGPYISYANCGIPYALGGVITDESKLHVQTPDKIAAWFDVAVRTGAEVVAVDRAAKSVTVSESGEGGVGTPNDAAAATTTTTVPYDKLVIATGSEPMLPPPAAAAVQAGAKHIFGLHTIPDLQKIQAFIASVTAAGSSPPAHAAVIGAGFIGIEAAENLARLGLNVSLLEYGPHVFPPVDSDIAEPLHAELRRKGVQLFLNSRVGAITSADKETGRPAQIEHATAVLGPDGRTTVSTKAEDPLRADLVIVAAGVRPRSALAKAAGLAVDGATGAVLVDTHMRSVTDGDVYAVGDVVATRHLVLGRDAPCALAGPANRQGRLAADDICGRVRDDGDGGSAGAEAAYRGNLGTSVCRVFDRAVAIVGLSTAALARLPGMRRGETFDYVTVHPPSHAGYYPGAEPTTMRVAFAVPSGRILGAQIVGGGSQDGGGGVDKRIDVLATAMRAGMAVQDLEHLELAYAPPFGSAKDPVNMAGFVASNVLRGDVRIVHAEDLLAEGGRGLAGYRVVDVRSPSEYAAGHVRTAVNVPLGELRDAVAAGKLGGDDERPLLVYCWVGYRGYIAYRMLRQMGLDAFNLDGGFKNCSQGGYDSLCEMPENET